MCAITNTVPRDHQGCHTSIGWMSKLKKSPVISDGERFVLDNRFHRTGFASTTRSKGRLRQGDRGDFRDRDFAGVVRLDPSVSDSPPTDSRSTEIELMSSKNGGSKMPTAPFGDDLWLTPGIRSRLRKIRIAIKALLARILSKFSRTLAVS